MKTDSILKVALRIIRQSERSPSQFIIGGAWRLVERLLDVVPMLVCFWWLQSVLLAGVAIASPSVAVLAAVLVSIFVVQLFCAMQAHKNSFLGSYAIMAGYREKLLDRVHQLPLGTLYRYRTGQLTDMATEDVVKIENIFTHMIIDLFTSFLIPLLLLVGLMWIDWRLALSFLICLPVAFVVLQLTRKLYVRMSQTKQEASRETSGLIVEFVTGIKTLRLYNKADLWLTKLYRQFDEMVRLSIKVEQWGAGPIVLYRLLIEFGLVFFLLASANAIESSSVSPLTLLLFMLLAYRVISPLLELGEHLSVLRYAVQSEQKLNTLYEEELLAEPEYAEGIHEYTVRFENVEFGYDETTVLNNVSFTAPAKTITAIVGPSGSGKSTIVNLLARFYDPNQGDIVIGDKSIRAIGSEKLYENISMVFQQVQLFDGTIIDNVRIGRPNATDEEVFEACRLAYCDEFIQQLPEKYQTYVGESGASLSGGERQRLSIARAILKDSPIILLDEASASVDAITQYHIQQALTELVKDKTVIMIAHRLSTVRDADQILVLDDGHIVERGTHQQLLNHEGLYAQLWYAGQ